MADNNAELVPFAAQDQTGSKARLARYRRIRTGLDAERVSYMAHWRDLADYYVPRRMRVNPSERNRGEKVNQNIVDSTQVFAARTLASGLHAGLTSPARPWFKLTLNNQELGEQPAIKTWLHTVTQRMLQMFLQTNVYNTLPIVYGDMGVFGTGAMSVLPDAKDLFRCSAYPIGSYWLGLDSRGVCATFMREYELTVRQVVEQFAVTPDGRYMDRSKLSKRVRDAWDKANYEDPVSVTWIVTPNDLYDTERLASKYARFASCYFETAEEQAHTRFLDERGFKTFPIMGPRWATTGEDVYGTDCPGMTALGDAKQLQIAQRRKGMAIWKMIDPPLQAPVSMRTQKTSLVPGDVSYVDETTGMKGIRPIHETNLNLQHLVQDNYDTSQRINTAFYADLFLMLANSDRYSGGVQPPTAREVEERHEEKLIALGPVLERTNDELLDPLIDRTFAMMLDAGMFPPPPPQIEGVNLKTEYTSIMAQAQKLVGVVGVDRFFMSVMPMTQTYPEALNKIDVNESVDFYAEALGVPPKLIRPTEEAQALSQQQQQAQAAAMATEQAATAAKAARDASQATLDGNTALSEFSRSMGAQATPPGASRVA